MQPTASDAAREGLGKIARDDDQLLRVWRAMLGALGDVMTVPEFDRVAKLFVSDVFSVCNIPEVPFAAVDMAFKRMFSWRPDDTVFSRQQAWDYADRGFLRVRLERAPAMSG